MDFNAGSVGEARLFPFVIVEGLKHDVLTGD